jgi:hypothetical protein
MAIHSAEATLGALHAIRTVVECRSCQLASSCHPDPGVKEDGAVFGTGQPRHDVR